MGLEMDRVELVRAAGPLPGADAVSGRAQQHWDAIVPASGPEPARAVARIEVFEGAEQWGVRVLERAGGTDEAELLRVVAKLLVWHARCPTETVDVVLSRSHAHHTLVRVSGDYV